MRQTGLALLGTRFPSKLKNRFFTSSRRVRTDLQSRFEACSFHPLKSAIHELAIWPGSLLAALSAINNDWAFVQRSWSHFLIVTRAERSTSNLDL
jgi:hypothetical protein